MFAVAYPLENSVSAVPCKAHRRNRGILVIFEQPVGASAAEGYDMACERGASVLVQEVAALCGLGWGCYYLRILGVGIEGVDDGVVEDISCRDEVDRICGGGEYDVIHPHSV